MRLRILFWAERDAFSFFVRRRDSFKDLKGIEA